MKKNIMLILVLLNSSACSLPSYVPTTIKELLPVGTMLRLTQPIEIPADRSYIYIAAGKVVPLKPFNTVNIYYPYCTFHMRTTDSHSRHVRPDRFKVTKVVEWEDYHGSLDMRKFIAGTSTGSMIKVRRAAYNDDGGLPTIMYATILSLYSPKQPEVKELVCGHWDDMGIVEPLTLEEMKSALGDLIQLEMKPRVDMKPGVDLKTGGAI